MTTNTIDLARDADGHVHLTDAQAAAVARWYLSAPGMEAAADNAVVIAAGGRDPDLTAMTALSRYVLRTAAERERVADAMPDPAALDDAAALLATVNDGAWLAAAKDLELAAQRIRDWQSTVRAAGLAGDA